VKGRISESAWDTSRWTASELLLTGLEGLAAGQAHGSAGHLAYPAVTIRQALWVTADAVTYEEVLADALRFLARARTAVPGLRGCTGLPDGTLTCTLCGSTSPPLTARSSGYYPPTETVLDWLDGHHEICLAETPPTTCTTLPAARTHPSSRAPAGDRTMTAPGRYQPDVNAELDRGRRFAYV
jgi:hypothetical protein